MPMCRRSLCLRPNLNFSPPVQSRLCVCIVKRICILSKCICNSCTLYLCLPFYCICNSLVCWSLPCLCVSPLSLNCRAETQLSLTTVFTITTIICHHLYSSFFIMTPICQFSQQHWDTIVTQSHFEKLEIAYNSFLIQYKVHWWIFE